MTDLMRQDQALPFHAVRPRTGPPPDPAPTSILATRTLSVWYGSRQALDRVTLEIPRRRVTAIVGPGGSGKSTLLRSLCRRHHRASRVRVEGQVLLRGDDLYRRSVRPAEVWHRIGLVERPPQILAGSLRERLRDRLGSRGARPHVGDAVEAALRGVELWDEVEDWFGAGVDEPRLGQGLRLGITRALATGPDVLLLDDPTSGLGAGDVARIEDLVRALGRRLAVVVATRDPRQAARVSDHAAFFFLGRLEELGETGKIFEAPATKRTENYITDQYD